MDHSRALKLDKMGCDLGGNCDCGNGIIRRVYVSKVILVESIVEQSLIVCSSIRPLAGYNVIADPESIWAGALLGKTCEEWDDDLEEEATVAFNGDVFIKVIFGNHISFNNSIFFHFFGLFVQV